MTKADKIQTFTKHNQQEENLKETSACIAMAYLHTHVTLIVTRNFACDKKEII